MYKGKVINVSQLGDNFMIAGKYPVLDMCVNEVTTIGSVKAPEAAAAAYPMIENIVFDGELGWLPCSSEAGWLDAEKFRTLAAFTIMEYMNAKGILFNKTAEELSTEVYDNAAMAEIMAADPAKLYMMMVHLKQTENDQVERRKWISEEIKKFLSPAPLPANSVEQED